MSDVLRKRVTMSFHDAKMYKIMRIELYFIYLLYFILIIKYFNKFILYNVALAQHNTAVYVQAALIQMFLICSFIFVLLLLYLQSQRTTS